MADRRRQVAACTHCGQNLTRTYEPPDMFEAWEHVNGHARHFPSPDKSTIREVSGDAAEEVVDLLAARQERGAADRNRRAAEARRCATSIHAAAA